MFSGIAETTGLILQATNLRDCLRVIISPAIPFTDSKLGDSVAVNGVCLTVTALQDNTFSADIVPETLRLSNLKTMSPGTIVNLERSLKIGDRNSGHNVQGHVDSVGEITEIIADGADALLVKINLSQTLTKYIVRKGFVAVDGMSLTVIDADETSFTVTLIPHTRAVTIAKDYSIGTLVNIEVDMMAKYLEKIVRSYQHA